MLSKRITLLLLVVCQLLCITLLLSTLPCRALCLASNNNNKPQCGSTRPRSTDLLHRRQVLLGGSVMTTLTAASSPITAATAAGEGSQQRMVLTTTPHAPTAALLPALQQRLLLESCRLLVANITTSQQDDDETRRLLLQQQLQSILPPLLEDSTSLDRKNDDLKVLQDYPPTQALRGRVVRAAMNVYLGSLQYGSNPQYKVVDADWKRNYIRAHDGLPAAQKVVAADLELRTLYRNQVQGKVDDAAAEFDYIIKKSSNSRNSSTIATLNDEDWQELQTLLQQAAETFDLWLDRIADDDVRLALQAVLQGESLRLRDDDSYVAGFVPPPPRSSF